MCDCRSYNRPDLSGGGIPEVTLPTPPWETGRTNGVPVDACIAATVEALWDQGVHTIGSCCGHNGVFGRPHVILPEGVAPEHARAALTRIDPDRQWDIKQWQLVTT